MSQMAHSITLERTIRASASDLYKAWTEPTILRRWIANVVEADVKVGGSYRLEIHHKDGSLREISGVFQVLEPTRLVLTFEDIDTRPGIHVDERVDVSFEVKSPSITELRVVHGWDGQPMTPAERSALEADWTVRLERLVGGVELPTTLDG